MVVYNGAVAGQLYYNIYDGASWTGAATLSTGTASTAIWVRLEARPDSDEMMAVALKSDLSLYAVHWSSIAWANGDTMTASAGSTIMQNFDVAWETNSGDALVVYYGGIGGQG